MVGKNDVGQTGILIRSGNAALAHLNESRKEEREYYMYVPCMSKGSFWHTLVDILLFGCYGALLAVLFVLATRPGMEEPEMTTWQGVTSGGAELFFESCGSICYYILVGVYLVTVLMAVLFAIAFWRMKALQLYSQYINAMLGVTLITTPIVQGVYLTSVYLHSPQVLISVLGFIDDLGVFLLFLCAFLRQYQLYRLLCTKKKTRCIKIMIRFLVLYASVLALAFMTILLCEFTDYCPLWAFDIYYFLPGLVLVCSACYGGYKMRSISYIFRDQQALLRLVAFEVYLIVIGLSHIGMGVIAAEISYYCVSILSVWIFAAELQGSYVVNNLYKSYRGSALFEEDVILKDVYTILDGSKGVAQIVMDTELQDILCQCAKARYCDECAIFLADICRVMPGFKYTEMCCERDMLTIVDKYVQTKQPTSLNIESQLRSRVLDCALNLLNELHEATFRLVRDHEIFRFPTIDENSTDTASKTEISTTLTPGTDVSVTHTIAIADIGKTSRKETLGQEICEAACVPINSSVTSISAEYTSDISLTPANQTTSYTQISSNTITQHLDCATTQIADVDHHSSDRKPSLSLTEKRSQQVVCSSKAAYNLGKALEETAESVCVLLRFSGVFEATKKDPRFIEITENRARLAQDNLIKIL